MHRPLLLLLLFATVATAQNSDTGPVPSSHTMHDSMQMPSGMRMGTSSFIDLLQQHQGAGTDAMPASTPSEMFMFRRGSWNFMFHGEAFLNEIQQSGPRGSDKFFSTNWGMFMAQHKLGHGVLTLRPC